MSAGLEAARRALADGRAWLVGGAVRDRLLGRESADVDIVLEGEPAAAARALARAAGGAARFALSDEFGAWRVVARDGSWQVDLEPMRGGGIEADLALRDFTINAIAEPLAGGAAIDPLGGARDLAAGRLRAAGPAAFAVDPLRVLRLVRMAVEFDLAVEPETLAAARGHAGELTSVAAERTFAELRRIIAGGDPRRGLALLEQTGALAVVLPELRSLHGVEQNRFHHLDVYEHTLAVLDGAIALDGSGPLPAALEDLDERHREQLLALLREPLADELTRGQALRWGALLHDVAKPLTRAESDGRVTFLGHDVRGAELAREVLTRLRASERLRAQVAALVRNHLRLGFLVHEPQPLSGRTVFAHLRVTAPVEVDVTLLSIVDRLATRGARSQEAIAAHMAVAMPMLAAALDWREHGPPRPLVRGDVLARELGIATGPRVGQLLEELAAAQYAGELRSPEDALAHARQLQASD